MKEDLKGTKIILKMNCKSENQGWRVNQVNGVGIWIRFHLWLYLQLAMDIDSEVGFCGW